MTTIGTIPNLLGLSGGDFREQNDAFQLLLGLNQDRFNAVCALLQGLSFMEAAVFRRSVEQLLGRGYQLTSLVADLRCSSPDSMPKFWTCDVRPKIGAKARKMTR